MFNCTNIPLIPDPKGVDKAIQQIQTNLGGISWMEFAFGKVYKRWEIRKDQRYFIPKAYGGGKEYIPLDPNDEVLAFSFIENGDEDLIQDTYEPLRHSWMSEVNLNIVVFANLTRIDNDKDYIFDEELKDDVLNAINASSCVTKINGIVKGLDKAYSEYSYPDQNRYFTELFAAFKVSVTVTLDEKCYDPATYNIQSCP